jgi:ubiquinone/menaquinone biosynthesis C-methylase UbiE
MRDYRHIERYLNELQADVYAQPPDDATQSLIAQLAKQWLPHLHGLDSILDVGCAQGQAIPVLEEYCDTVIGVTLGTDAMAASHAGHKVYLADMTFLPFAENEFKLLWCRHVLEHSPMPLITLMEWHRVAKTWCIVAVPSVEKHDYGEASGQHYYVLHKKQWENLFYRSGWHVVWYDDAHDVEYRWMLEKKTRAKGTPG